MADALKHHKSCGQKSLHLIDNAQHIFPSIIVAKKFFHYNQRQNLCFWHKNVEKQMAKARQRDIFYFCVWKLEQPYVETKLYRTTAKPFTVLQAYSLCQPDNYQKQLCRANIKIFIMIKDHLISSQCSHLQGIQLIIHTTLLRWQIMPEVWHREGII